MHTHDILEALGKSAAVAAAVVLRPTFERAQTVHMNGLGIGKGVGEDLLELAEHGDHVGVLGGTVVLMRSATSSVFIV